MFSLFNILGYLMSFWYIAYRWYMFADKIKYDWAYKPINLVTAFISIPFIIITLFTPDKSYYVSIFWVGVFLIYRNCWYTLEDVKDYIFMIRHPGGYSSQQIKEQILFIIVDVMMLAYTAIWIGRYKVMTS